jgi:hypothetical protein
MKYHNNVVTISVQSDYSLIQARYTVTSDCVTDGQDPDGKVFDGLIVSSGGDGKLTFEVGRKGSKAVADWFNARIGSSQNTFDHSADDLNFAFLGILELTIKDNKADGQEQTTTFQDISLAQGNTGSSNNWWFGGKSCSHLEDNQVTCLGLNAQNETVSFIFLRGGLGNDVSTVNVTPSRYVIPSAVIDTANWMKNIPDTTRLDGIMMPGSHDAGMSELNHCSVGANSQNTQTQSGSIGQQLLDGSRYFDVRVDYDHEELVTYHRTGPLGCNGQSLIQILDEAQDFLVAHAGETAILKFSHIRNSVGPDQNATKSKINDLLNGYNAVIYTNPMTNINLAQLTLGDVRGKMIVVFDYTEHINSSTGRFCYHDGSSAEPNITVYDVYAEESDYEAMKANQLQKWKEFGGMGKGYLFLLSWTLTYGNIQEHAAEANAKLSDVLYDQIIKNGASKPNIVYIDFVDSTVTQSIIQYNF